MQIFISGKVYDTTAQTTEQIERQVNTYINRVGYYDQMIFKLEVISDNEILLTYDRKIPEIHHADMLSYRDANLVCGITESFELPQMWGVCAPCDNVYMERSFLAKSYKYNSRILCPQNRIVDVNVMVTTANIKLRIKY